MCGIVGFTGQKDAAPYLIEGLEKLEYRGYDSAGVAIHSGEGIITEKAKGRLSVLAGRLAEHPIHGHLGIGHTRWATHGEPSDRNAHPHYNQAGTVAVIHNGIIENYLDIKRELGELGYTFSTETDTETVAHLIDFYLGEGMEPLDAVFKVLSRIEGSYGLGIILADMPDTLIAARKDSPLLCCRCEEGGFIASDVSAVLKYTRDVFLLHDYEVAVVTKDAVQIYDIKGNPVTREPFTVTWDAEAAERGGFEHFMQKEIHEQPKVARDTLATRLGETDVVFEGVTCLTPEYLAGVSSIHMVACGSAHYVSQVGAQLIERIARLPVKCAIASEFRYCDPLIDDKSLVIIVSQSGETADTIAALRLAKKAGARVLAVVNVLGSSIAREADEVIYTVAGPEIAVASTKAFYAQYVVMVLIAAKVGIAVGKLSQEDYVAIRQSLAALPALTDHVLKRQHHIEQLAERYIASKNVFYVGRGLDAVASLEGALKLKEIAYLHSEQYPAGELKHGPIALIEKATLIVGTVTQEDLAAKTASNLMECNARGARILAIAMEGNTDISRYVDDVFFLPRTHPMVAPLLAVVAMQIFSYHVAVRLGNDVDKPRNLAKSVTVE